MKYVPTFLICLAVLFLAGLLPFDAFAQAQDANSWQCDGGTSINKIFCGITTQFRYLPKLLAIFAYVIAAILAFKGLLQLREYGDDPSKTPLQSIVIKFALAAALISLPLAMQLFITTVTGASSVNGNVEITTAPTLGTGVSGK
jgi:hypothetical protein